MVTEKALRRQDHLPGVPLRLADGELWTISARPLVGPVAVEILALLAGLDELALRAMHQGNALTAAQIRTQAALRRADDAVRARPVAAPEGGEAPAAKPKELEEVTALAAALKREDGEIRKLQGQLEAIEKERTEKLGALLLAVMQRNYPKVTLDQLGELVDVGHLEDVLAIVKGERQLRELHGTKPEGKAEPAPPSG